VHRRFTIWSDAGLWGRLHHRLRELLADTGLVDLSLVLVDTAHVCAKKLETSQFFRGLQISKSPP
jgi:transposase